MASFSIGGIVSGLDTNSIIDSLVAAASTPKTVMAAKKAKVEKLQTAYEELSSRLTDMQTALEAIDTAEEFRSLSGTSTNDDVATVTVDGDGVVGTYNLAVTQLADSAMLVSNDLFADEDTTNVGLTGDSITVTYAGTSTVITLASDQTLEELAATINEEVDGVTAYVMNTGSGYKLVYSGEDTGASKHPHRHRRHRHPRHLLCRWHHHCLHRPGRSRLHQRRQPQLREQQPLRCHPGRHL